MIERKSEISPPVAELLGSLVNAILATNRRIFEILESLSRYWKAKLDGKVTRIDDRPAKSLSQIRIEQQPAGISRSNIVTPPRFQQGPGITNAGSNLHVASGPAFQSQPRSSGKLTRW